MPAHKITFALALSVFLSGGLLGVNAIAQQPSIADGVYTDAQADGAKSLYTDRCATCHGDNLGGSAAAPPLSGFPFTSFYTGKTLGDLWTVLHGMPADSPGSLSDAQYVRLLALILKTNGYPAGDKELAPDAQVLSGISFVAPPAK